MAEIVNYNVKEKLAAILQRVGQGIGHVLRTGHLDPAWFEDEEEYHKANKLFRTLKNGEQKRKHEEIEEYDAFEDMEEYEPLSNSPHEEQAMNGEEQNMGGRAAEEGGEQQVTKPHHIWRKFPNTETALLKYVVTQFISTAGDISVPPNEPWDQSNEKTATSLLSTGGGAISNPAFNGLSTASRGYDFFQPASFLFRMTSLYDIYTKGYGASIGGFGMPAWTELFDQKYQYYHIMETEWKLRVTFGWPSSSGVNVTHPQDFAYYIFWKYINEDEPPTNYGTGTNMIANVTQTDQTTITINNKMTNDAGAQYLTPDDYFRMGGWQHKHVQLNNVKNSSVVVGGKYKFGQCKMDIKTISSSDAHSLATTAEGWNKAKNIPVFPENLVVHIVSDNAFNENTGIKTPASFRWESEHLVQFKDLQPGYKFPTPTYAKSAGTTLNTDLAFFSTGAAYT